MATPPMTPTSNQRSLDAVWDEACIAFKNAAGIDLKNGGAPSAADIRSKFDAKRSKDADDHRKVDKVKDVFSKTMTCIDRVGGIAAAGASMVFGSPATIAASALSFFIDAGVQYRSVFANIEDLLSRIVVVLERFQIYRDNQDQLPQQIIRVANKLLVAVVNICGLCCKALNKSKFSTFFKVALFSDDRGVQAQLARLQALEAEESQMKGTLNLVAAETTKRNIATGFAQTSESISKVSGGVQKLEEAFKDSKEMEELRDFLQITKEKESSYQDEHRRYLDDLSGESCLWLHDDPVYQSWRSFDDNQTTILLLSGEEGFGKSYTVTAMVDDLNTRYPQRQQTADRVSVAHCYLTRTNKDGRDGKDGKDLRDGKSTSLQEVIRFFAWQIAQNDIFYRKDITATCKRQALGKTHEMWKQLFLDCYEEEATFFLVLDGIQELDTKEQELLADLVQLLAKTPRGALRLKILLASRDTFAKDLRLKAPGITQVTVADRSRPDLERHIRKAADKLSIFQKQTKRVQDLKSDVCKGLSAAVGGSFLYADYLLREIDGKYDPAEVMAIVEKAKAGGNLADSITDAIKKCNQNLGSKELQDLNTILLWIIHGEWSFDLRELEAILFIQRGESLLKSLYKQIHDLYSDFLMVIPDEDAPYSTVMLKSDTISEFFKTRLEERSSTASAAAKTLSKGEIKIVQNFILKLCEQDVYDRLGLSEFFEQKLSESDTTISVDIDNAHALISIDLLKAFTGEQSDGVEGLFYYAPGCLPKHLRKMDLDVIDPRYKAEIGPLLIKLLRDQASIENASTNFRYFNQWTYGTETQEQIVRIMRSTAVMKKVIASGGKIKDWVATILESKTPEIDVFKPMSQIQIRRWLACTEESCNVLAFLWLLGYFNQIKFNEDPQNQERLEYMPRIEQVSVDYIREVFEWVQDQSDRDYDRSESLRNLGGIYTAGGRRDEAVAVLRDAMKADPDNLRVRYQLARAYSHPSNHTGKCDPEAAMEHIECVIDATASGKSVFESTTAVTSNYIYRKFKAEMLTKLGTYDEAETFYRAILTERRQLYDALKSYILLMCEQERHTDVVALLQELESETHIPEKDEALQDISQSWLSRLFHEFTSDDDLHHRIVHAFRQADALSLVKNHYEMALDDAAKLLTDRNRTNVSIYCSSTLRLANLLHFHGRQDEERERAIRLWESLAENVSEKDISFWPRYFSSRFLASVYISNAVIAGSDTQTTQEMAAKIDGLGLGDGPYEAVMSKTQVRALLCRLHSALGDQSRAREAIKENIKVGVMLLSDEDDDNDYMGWQHLAEAFMSLGDDVNSTAAWKMIIPSSGLETDTPESEQADPAASVSGTLVSASATKEPGETVTSEITIEGSASMTGDTTVAAKSMDEDHEATLPERPQLKRSKTSQLEQKLEGPLGYVCDGDCGREWSFADDMWNCRTCPDVSFDTACMQKLKAGNLGRDVCDPKHEFFHVPPWDPAMVARVRSHIILVGETEMPVADWLAGLRTEWGIEPPKEDAAAAADAAA